MAKPNSTPLRRELILLDFHEHAIEDALIQLLRLAQAGEINGLAYVARYTEPGTERHIFGVEGRYGVNADEALGAITRLQMRLASI